MVTERIKLGTSIFLMWGRHPISFVQQCVALAAIAPGRFRLGIGPSHQPGIEALFGVPWKQPLGRLREQLLVLTNLLRTGEVSFDGEFFKTEARLATPVDVPVMISALRPASFRLAGELADGAISWVCPWTYLREVALPEMREAAADAGRDAPPLISHVNVCLSEDRETVREAAREQIGRYPRLANYHAMFQLAGFEDPAGRDLDAIIDTLVVVGTDQAIADRLATIRREGAGEIIVHPIFLGDDRATYQGRIFDLVARANRQTEAAAG
jgi:alkanesulfonate monooxygenase SsuD/methylene tetrahydromethanopterin reductase-like flavin-dependent oxidoreductase (luciferase family)